MIADVDVLRAVGNAFSLDDTLSTLTVALEYSKTSLSLSQMLQELPEKQNFSSGLASCVVLCFCCG